MKLKITKTVATLLLSSTLCLAGQYPGQPLVTVTGKLDPKFSVEINPDDLKKVADGLKSLSSLDPQDIDINDLMSEGDGPAIKTAAQRISDIFVESAKNLIDMRVLIYRLAALTSVSVNTQDYTDSLIKAYQQKFETDYRSIVGLFNQLDKSLIADILACKSELCAIQVSNAQIELLQFAKQISHGIDLKKHKVIGTKLVVTNAIVTKALALTYEGLRSGGSDYSNMLAAGLSPFVSASQDSAAFGNKMSDLMNGSTEQNVSVSPLYAHKVKSHARLFTRAVKAVVSRKILSIVNNLPLNSPDLNKLTGRHSRFLSLITCFDADSDHINWAAAVGGVSQDMQDGPASPITRGCTDLLSGDTYSESERAFGVGAGVGVSAQEVFLLISPIPLNNHDLSGTWRGLELNAAALLEVDGGVLFGPRASVLIRLGTGAGAGALLGVGRIELDRDGSSEK